MKKIKNIISALFILGVFCLILWVALSLRFYQAFNKEELVASVSCQKSSDSAFDYIIFYHPLTQKEPVAFGIKGNQWRIEGVVIKWKGWVNVLGVHTWHKPVRLSGRFSRLKAGKNPEPTDYVLNEGEDNFWRFIYANSQRLPFVEASYGSAAFVPCQENVVYKVYVTTSGYMIKSAIKPKE